MRCLNSNIFLLAALLFVSCNTIDVYERTAAIPRHEWSSNNQLSFDFTVTDTLAYYNIYLVLRHSEAYHFNNIWINFTSTAPGGKPQAQKLNLMLASPDKWLGAAMDDIIEERVLLFNKPTRLSKGDYKFSLQQLMREDPLEHVLNAGIRVQKVVR